MGHKNTPSYSHLSWKADSEPDLFFGASELGPHEKAQSVQASEGSGDPSWIEADTQRSIHSR